MNYYKNKNILIIGCGGTGSEIIKLLKHYPKIKKITVVDYDKIELSNLSRQFIYTKKEKGNEKALIMSQKMNCTAIVKRIQEIDLEIINKYDIIFGCVDTISARMDINYIFNLSNCELFIDCGVEGMKSHVKKITKNTACLYCIKDLFKNEKNDLYLCSLKSINENINETNRIQIIKNLIFKFKDKEFDKKILIQKIVKKFNEIAPEELKTCFFEIYGLYNNIIPNICIINSICASIAVNIISSNFDFIYYDGTKTPYFNKLNLQKDSECILCHKNN